MSAELTPNADDSEVYFLASDIGGTNSRLKIFRVNPEGDDARYEQVFGKK